jgi:adenosylcobinamide-GDP ribazoletransferase|tara:strand:- start:3643 stop:4410 length:768 start_codon:yes stop_codon:yes gene_type:complete
MNKNDLNDTSFSNSLWDIVVAATMLTRLPLPQAPDEAFERQEENVWAFPLIGVIVGIIACIVGAIAFGLGLNAPITAGLMLATTMIMTGAMHEDGLADCADGFWGGFDPDRRLEIMKDSQIGTYGVLALVIFSGLRWLALSAVISLGFAGVMAAAVLSRGVLPAIMAMVIHARDTGLSHSVGRPTQQAAATSFAAACVLALILIGSSAISAAIITALIAFAVAKLAKVKVGGQTGDVLGATQVLCETAILIFLIA